MATHTVTFNNRIEMALAWRVDVINVERAAQDPPKDPITVDEYIQRKSKESLQADIDAYEAYDRNRVAEAYAAASAAVQTKVKTDLGLV